MTDVIQFIQYTHISNNKLMGAEHLSALASNQIVHSTLIG